VRPIHPTPGQIRQALTTTSCIYTTRQAASVVDPAIDRFADAASLLKGAGGVFTALAQVIGVDTKGVDPSIDTLPPSKAVSFTIY